MNNISKRKLQTNIIQKQWIPFGDHPLELERYREN